MIFRSLYNYSIRAFIEWPHSFLWPCFAATATSNVTFHFAKPSDAAQHWRHLGECVLLYSLWRYATLRPLQLESATPSYAPILYVCSQRGCTLQEANSNRMFSLEVKLENNLTRTHPTIENLVSKSSLSVINNGVTFITEMYGVLPIRRRETHFARNKSVCELSDGCCGLHSQLGWPTAPRTVVGVHRCAEADSD